MSDFLFTSKKKGKGILGKHLKSIYVHDPPDCVEYHGPWGSLCVADNHYKGFNPYESERHIIAVIGAPILKFRGSSALSGVIPSNYKTAAILKKWENGGILWDKELSGPFSIICIDKMIGTAEIVTDMLSFIPVYSASLGIVSNGLVFGTHVDTVAEVAKDKSDLDQISLVDFIINKTVSYPYTLYQGVRQVTPASVTLVENGIADRAKEMNYWTPVEENTFSSIDDATYAVRCALRTSVLDICEDVNDVGVLLSGGEDSRAVLAAIPDGIKKTGYLFIDSYNREARTAKRIADIYGSDFMVGYRSPTHYLDQIQECIRLVGLQNEFTHVHAYGFHKKFRFEKHDAILGGLKSDTFLKGYYIPLWQFNATGSRIFSAKFKRYLGNRKSVIRHLKEEIFKIENRVIFSCDLLENVAERQLRHLHRVAKFRHSTLAEWIKIWPISQDQEINNFNGHRRLFRNCEPFLSSDIVKLAASVPPEWKIGRRLFQRATKPLLRRSWFVPHAGEGHFPYFSGKPNIALRFFCTKYREIYRKSHPSKHYNQGPWPDWDAVVKTKQMDNLIEEHEAYYGSLKAIFNNLPFSNLFNKTSLDSATKLRILQVAIGVKSASVI